jgi:hypothetical protein
MYDGVAITGTYANLHPQWITAIFVKVSVRLQESHAIEARRELGKSKNVLGRFAVFTLIQPQDR